MISKLATYGATREEAINRMQRALREYYVGGIRTTIPFFQGVLEDAEFRRGEIDTGFIARYFERTKKIESASDETLTNEEVAAAMVAAYDFSRQQQLPASNSAIAPASKWKASGRRSGN